jgi:threonine/homoserine/homoserine lactone efflux protein
MFFLCVIFAIMGIINFTSFILASLIFVVSPGIDTMFVLNKSVIQGKKTGFYAAMGICTGVLIHTTLAAFGLSLLLAKSVLAFSIIKYLGAAYLIYLGFFKLISQKKSQQALAPTVNAASSVGKTFLAAVLTNILNPKVAIFFLAFFPQFISPVAITSALPFIVLGSAYAFLSLFWFSILALFAGAFTNKLQSNSLFNYWLNRCSAVIFIVMGLKIAFTKR